MTVKLRSSSSIKTALAHYLANGRINGRLVTFLLDTGATQVAIPGRMANLLGVEPGPAVQVRTASGIATAYRTEIAELQLGDIRLYNVCRNHCAGL